MDRRTELPFVPVAARAADGDFAAAVRDLAWLPDGRLAIAAGEAALLLWRPGTVAIDRIEANVPRHGCSITRLARHPTAGLLAHVGFDRGGSLRRFDEATNVLCEHAELPFAATIAIDARGRVLAMHDLRGLHTVDLVLAPDGRVQLPVALGVHAAENGGFRADGAARLHFLGDCVHGNSRPRTLFAIDDACAVVRVGDWGEQPMQSTTVVVEDDAALYRVAVGRDRSDPPRAIERYDLDGGQVVWSRPLRNLVGDERDFTVTALAYWRAAGVLLVALSNGMLYGVEPMGGAIVHRDTPMPDGAPVTAIAVYDEAVALGARTGALAVYASR